MRASTRGNGTHLDVVVPCFRYLFERLIERQILAIDRATEVVNCSVTSYRVDPALSGRGKFTLELFNDVAPLQEAGQKGTKESDANGVTG